MSPFLEDKGLPHSSIIAPDVAPVTVAKDVPSFFCLTAHFPARIALYVRERRSLVLLTLFVECFIRKIYSVYSLIIFIRERRSWMNGYDSSLWLIIIHRGSTTALRLLIFVKRFISFCCLSITV